ncbi:hypothetical protein CVT26_003333 [Gymnopilus dilepis]|uniref:DUF6534 domain-containing protein n=1 Tax=Gymnopilus dilepis TaxID=231916 RepID=A0A409W2T8_9AGAR|nr:hypothetical protein CVT26_003333 [Gymnopilus dilepis]
MEVTLSNTVGAGFLGYTASLSFRPTGTTVIINSIGYFRKLQLVDTVHMGMTIHTVYYYVIENFGNIFALEEVVWYSLSAWSDLSQPNVASIVKATFACITGIDNILAIAMCYFLQKSRSSFSSTNHRIVAVIHYVLVSGALTSAASLVVLVTFLTMPNNLIFIGITFFLAKLYINSYIAMLNARQPKREESYSGGRIMHLHSASGQMDDPSNKEVVQLSAIGARVAIKEASSGELKRSKVPIASNIQTGEVIDIKVHRTEERIVDDSKGSSYWSAV